MHTELLINVPPSTNFHSNHFRGSYYGLDKFLICKENMQKQSEQQLNNLKILNEQQIYARLTEVRLKLQNSEEFTRMAAASPIYVERFAIVE